MTTKIRTLLLLTLMVIGSSLAIAGITVSEAMRLRDEGKSVRMLNPNGYKTKSALQGFGSKGERMRINKNPNRVTSSGADFYGWCVYCSDESLYPSLWAVNDEDVTLDRNIANVKGPILKEYATLSNGYLKDGVVYGYIKESYLQWILGIEWATYDYSTGEQLSCEILDLYTAPIFSVMAYVPEDGLIYGIGHLYTENSPLFMVVDPKNPGVLLSSVPVDVNQGNATSMCYNGSEGCFYIVNTLNNICRIQKDGYLEKLFKLKDENNKNLTNSTNYYSGLYWSPVDGKYYWNPNWADRSSMATIDITSGLTTILYDTPDCNQFAFFLSKDEATINPLKPAKPSIASVDFPNGSRSGTIVYDVPALSESGVALDGELKCYSYLDGSLYRSFDSNAGEKLSVEFNNLSEAEHTFVFYVSNQDVDSDKSVDIMWIGNDVPSEPKNVMLYFDKVTWSPVETGVHGGYVDHGDMTYEVQLNGTSLGITDKTEIEITLPSDEALGVYTANVTAICNNKRSDPGVSNSMIVGTPLDLPISIAPTEEDYKLCTVVDANKDNRKWFYDKGVPAFGTGYSDRDNCDDWIFLPPFEVKEAGKYYGVDFQTAIRNESYTNEYLSVYVSKEPNVASAVQILEPFTPQGVAGRYGVGGTYQDVQALFKVDEPGTYYIGFRSTSAPDQAGIYVKDIRISGDSFDKSAPMAVGNLRAYAAPGAKEANMSFTFPLYDVSGAEMPSDTQLTAKVKSPLETATVSGVPGAQASVTVAINVGDNRIEVTPLRDGVEGLVAKVDVFTGVVVPVSPENIKGVVSDDMLTIHLTWDPVTKGENDGFVIPEDIRYQVFRIDNGQDGLVFIPVSDEISEACYDYTMEEGASQGLYEFVVASMNSAGSNGVVDGSAKGIMGTPYSLPYSDDLENNGFETAPWLTYVFNDDYTAQWGLYYANGLNPAWGNNIVLWSVASESGTYGCMGTPRFTTIGAVNPSVTLNLYTGDFSPRITVLATCTGTEELMEIGKIEKIAGFDFTSVNLSLPEGLLNKYWVGLFFNVEFETENQMFVLDSIKVENQNQVKVDALSQNGLIEGRNGVIRIEGFENESVKIFTLSGIAIVDEMMTGNTSFDVEKGIYIVKVGDRTEKVTVN